MVNGLTPQVEGSVSIQGNDIYEYSPTEMLRFHRRCGYVFQNAALIGNMTLMENLSLGFRYHDELAHDQIMDKILPHFEFFDIENGLSRISNAPDDDGSDLNRISALVVDLERV